MSMPCFFEMEKSSDYDRMIKLPKHKKIFGFGYFIVFVNRIIYNKCDKISKSGQIIWLWKE